MTADPPFGDAAVAAVFAGYPAPQRDALLALRRLIFQTAAQTAGVGTLTEALKWSQPAYLTARPKSGTTIRIDAVKGSSTRYALHVHCQSRLAAEFRELYGDELEIEGDRAVIFDAATPLPEAAVRHCIALALTYHVRRRTAA